jgi:hypothetical protein
MWEMLFERILKNYVLAICAGLYGSRYGTVAVLTKNKKLRGS